jgi:hypothetical protein
MAVVAHPRSMHRNLAAMEADLALRPAQALPDRPPPRLCGAPARRCVLAQHIAPMPAVRQKHLAKPFSDWARAPAMKS